MAVAFSDAAFSSASLLTAVGSVQTSAGVPPQFELIKPMGTFMLLFSFFPKVTYCAEAFLTYLNHIQPICHRNYPVVWQMLFLEYRRNGYYCSHRLEVLHRYQADPSHNSFPYLIDRNKTHTSPINTFSRVMLLLPFNTIV